MATNVLIRKDNTCMGTKRKLAKLLTHLGQCEQKIEIARQKLCSLDAFEPYAAFQRLDRTGKGYVTPRDFANFMR